MKKSLKSKVVAGVVTVGLVSGMGFAVANTDIGGKLQSWYDGQFNTAGSQIETASRGYVNSLVPGLTQEYNNAKAFGTSYLQGVGTNAVSDSSDAINDKKDAYVSQLSSKETEISDDIATQFDWIFGLAKTELGKISSQYEQAALADVKNHVETVGGNVNGDVNDQLTQAKNGAISQLEQEIANAKSRLQNKLDTEKDATIEEIEDAVDAEIQKVRKSITEKGIALGLAQQKIIEKTASDIVTDAQAELDQVVADFN